MNLVLVLLLLLAAWIIWTVQASFVRLEAELREIRVKCVQAGATPTMQGNTVTTGTTEKFLSMLRGGLGSVLPREQSGA